MHSCHHIAPDGSAPARDHCPSSLDAWASDVIRHRAIPVTTPIRTIIDIAVGLPTSALEAAVDEADKLDLVDPERLRANLDRRKGQQGVRPLRTLLDRATFVLTDSELERRFLPIARRASLGIPETQTRVNGFKVDFHWPDLGLVVETDGLRYHRTHRTTDPGPCSRPGTYRRRAHSPAFHPLAGALRARPRARNPGGGGSARLPDIVWWIGYAIATPSHQTRGWAADALALAGGCRRTTKKALGLGVCRPAARSRFARGRDRGNSRAARLWGRPGRGTGAARGDRPSAAASEGAGVARPPLRRRRPRAGRPRSRQGVPGRGPRLSRPDRQPARPRRSSGRRGRRGTGPRLVCRRADRGHSLRRRHERRRRRRAATRRCLPRGGHDRPRRAWRRPRRRSGLACRTHPGRRPRAGARGPASRARIHAAPLPPVV